MKVFLGGTCNGSTWRDYVIEHMPEGVKFFNPVVDVWDEKARDAEELQKWGMCDTHVYVITPKMKGVFTIAEVVESSMHCDKNTIVCILPVDDELEFDEHQTASLEALKSLVRKYNGYTCDTIEDVIKYIAFINKAG